jgi:hypothetical protein
MDKVRGSQQLVANLKSRGGTFKQDELQRLVALTEELNVDITHWFPIGIPNVEQIQGAFRGEYENIGQLSAALFKLEAAVLGHVSVFPFGIPVIDGAELRFELYPSR